MNAVKDWNEIKSDAWDIPVAVIGARGYSGLELCRLLLRHQRAQITACFATGDFRLSDYLPEAAAKNVPVRSMDDLLPLALKKEFKIVFMATPVEVSAELAPKLLECGVSVVDLSGAFRLAADDVVETYKKWYAFDHKSAALVKEANYGLAPWAGETVPGASLGNKPALVSNPGCFATAVLMGVLPLVKEGLIDPSSLVIDAKSGTTGAGRKAEERLMHAEVEGLCLPYRVGRHQHLPEIIQTVKNFTGVTIDPHFSTSLLTVRRGIIAGIYAKVNPALPKDQLNARIQETFAKAYADDVLVNVTELTPANEGRILSLRRVVGSARTQLGYKVVDDKLYMFSLIDNLMKGAASQAVENFNRLMGLPTWTGLQEVEGVL